VTAINTQARSLARERGILSGDDVRFGTQRDKKSAVVEKSFAVGDRVIALQNDRGLGIKNGQTFTVTEARDGQLTLKRDGDGQQIKISDKQYRHIDHAYCATVHKSQGVTIDRAHVVHDSSMSDRSLSYVAASRHRESMSYHYSEHQRDELQREMARVRDKDTSVDYKRDDATRAWQQVAEKLSSFREQQEAQSELQSMRQQSQQQDSARTQQQRETTHERSEFVLER